MVATFLIAITVLIFMDVVQRRLTAPDSRLGQAIAKLLFIHDAGARAFIDAWVAPVVGIAGGLGFLYLAYRADERGRGRPLLPVRGSAVLLALATAAIIGGFGWLVLVMKSRDVYLL